MTALSTDDPTVADAETEAAEAESLVVTLEERVREGDDDVSPEQIERHRSLAGFARLRAEAARRKAARRFRDDVLAEDQAVADRVRASVKAADDLSKPLAKAQAAIAELVAAADARNSTAEKIRREMQALRGRAFEQDGLLDELQVQLRDNGLSSWLEVDEQRLLLTKPAELVAAAVYGATTGQLHRTVGQHLAGAYPGQVAKQHGVERA